MTALDVAVIGGSLAGSACVRELTRLGFNAVAYERDRFPREKVCGGFLSPGAVRILDQLGLLQEVRAAGAVVVRSARLRFQGREIRFDLPEPALGVSRFALDSILANHGSVQHGTVRGVSRTSGGFSMRVDEYGEVQARVVIDAAGKLSRFSTRRASPQFGVQLYMSEDERDVIDFWFFPGGYGGAVSVEGHRANACFLINKERLGEFVRQPACKVTGPVAYGSSASDFITIGDAAGMIDPFCGEGMRHALDTGRIAAAVTAEGLHRGRSYESMKHHYAVEHRRRWGFKRTLAGTARMLLRHPRIAGAGLQAGPEGLLRRFWA